MGTIRGRLTGRLCHRSQAGELRVKAFRRLPGHPVYAEGAAIHDDGDSKASAARVLSLVAEILPPQCRGGPTIGSAS